MSQLRLAIYRCGGRGLLLLPSMRYEPWLDSLTRVKANKLLVYEIDEKGYMAFNAESSDGWRFAIVPYCGWTLGEPIFRTGSNA